MHTFLSNLTNLACTQIDRQTNERGRAGELYLLLCQR